LTFVVAVDSESRHKQTTIHLYPRLLLNLIFSFDLKRKDGFVFYSQLDDGGKAE